MGLYLVPNFTVTERRIFLIYKPGTKFRESAVLVANDLLMYISSIIISVFVHISLHIITRSFVSKKKIYCSRCIVIVFNGYVLHHMNAFILLLFPMCNSILFVIVIVISVGVLDL